MVSSSESLVLTAACERRLQELQKEYPSVKDLVLYLNVEAGGCEGFQTTFKIASCEEIKNQRRKEEEEEEIEPTEWNLIQASSTSSSRLLIDSISLDLVKGSKIDFHQEMMRSAFVVADNPQAASGCGCGSSFTIKI